MQIGKYQEALQAAKRSVELSPGVRDAVLNYALSEMFLGNVLKTTALIEECVSSGNENITLQAVLGVSYCVSGYTDKGLAILKELARRRINNVPYYVNSLAAQLIASGQIEYARLLIDAALSGNIADRETLRLRDALRLKQNSPTTP
jgi:tetratricopeptide (TPR) repeat protein